ncbi:MAG: PLP-dependent aspartate aminotransferase family protein [Anaerolineales bacterium]|nr:PLP-dependent aspartate aminotransferase family protein [Anaerolineales bacterium]
MSAPKPHAVSTKLAQAGHYIDPATGAIVPPLHSAATFARDKNYELIGDFIYSRTQNPTGNEVEKLLTELEGGGEALLFASGLAAAAALFETVEAGKQILVPEVIYYGTLSWLRRISERRGIELGSYDPGEPDSLPRAIIPGKLDIVWIETPVNPTWDVIDIQAAADVVHEAGAILAVDSTVAPPVTTRPLALGADIVAHSATKYLNGHSDLTGGVLVTNRIDDRWKDIRYIREHAGGVLGAFESWLLLRGLRTLAIRYERCSESALRIARHFEHHPAIEAVLYPGLDSHPGHEIARRQMTNGFGGMLSILVQGGTQEALTVATGLELIVRATSLGGVESLVEHRASVEGPQSKVAPNLLRFSIGIEDPEDLIQDIEQALNSL